MTSSTTRRIRKIRAALFWILIWEIAALAIDEKLFLVSPVEVIITLARMIPQKQFLHSVGFSLVRILSGFLLGTFAGIILATFAYLNERIRILLAPLMGCIKSIPVASFIILILIWVSSRNLSIVISFLIVLPVTYSNILEGLDATDRKLLEMASLFRLTLFQKIRGIYTPQIVPFLQSALSLSIGLAFKSGIAAEVIGVPSESIGEKLFEAKIFFDTASLFAWTLAILLISTLTEKLILFLYARWAKRMEG